MVPHQSVAVVGGGIAGMGAAWALARAGCDVTVYEAGDALGGNAKVQRWQEPGGDVITGLSVLAWPSAYFHNYTRLLETLGIATEPTPPLRFFVDDGDHGRRFADDLQRWGRLASFVRAANRKLSRRRASDPPEPSLYDIAPHNPLLVVPLRKLCRAFGVSPAFWEQVFVPVHASSFLTTSLDALPAAIAPTLEDIISLEHGGQLTTWSGSSADVFARMSEGIRVHLGRRVRSVRRRDGAVAIDGESFDAVVLACSATTANAMLDGSDRRERFLLGGVRYADDRDPTFLRGVVHRNPDVLPAAHRSAILSGYANYIARNPRGGYETTFIISSWCPAARGSQEPMLVTYNRDAPIPGALRVIDNRRAHPDFDTKNLMRAFALRSIQGRRRSWFCGSYTTPGNGHDLSLLSGLVVAHALGAPYPFADHPAAARDFRWLQRIMLGRDTVRAQAAATTRW